MTEAEPDESAEQPATEPAEGADTDSRWDDKPATEARIQAIRRDLTDNPSAVFGRTTVRKLLAAYEEMKRCRDAAMRYAAREHVPIVIDDEIDIGGEHLRERIEESWAASGYDESWWADSGSLKLRDHLLDHIIAVIRPHLARLTDQTAQARAELLHMRPLAAEYATVPTEEETAAAVAAFETAFLDAVNSPDAHELWLHNPGGLFRFEHAALHADGKRYVPVDTEFDAVQLIKALPRYEADNAFCPAMRLVGKWKRSEMPQEDFEELLAASSLGSPQAQAIRAVGDATATCVHDELSLPEGDGA